MSINKCVSSTRKKLVLLKARKNIKKKINQFDWQSVAHYLQVHDISKHFLWIQQKG